MSNQNSMLLKMCTENVCNDNIFHVLGLRTSATSRQICCRRDDSESAYSLGGDSWKNEFRQIMCNRALLTYEEICEAFNKLENPESRIDSEFFWMWPSGDIDRALDELASVHRSEAIK